MIHSLIEKHLKFITAIYSQLVAEYKPNLSSILYWNHNVVLFCSFELAITAVFKELFLTAFEKIFQKVCGRIYNYQPAVFIDFLYWLCITKMNTTIIFLDTDGLLGFLTS